MLFSHTNLSLSVFKGWGLLLICLGCSFKSTNTLSINNTWPFPSVWNTSTPWSHPMTHSEDLDVLWLYCNPYIILIISSSLSQPIKSSISGPTEPLYCIQRDMKQLYRSANDAIIQKCRKWIWLSCHIKFRNRQEENDKSRAFRGQRHFCVKRERDLCFAVLCQLRYVVKCVCSSWCSMDLNSRHILT